MGAKQAMGSLRSIIQETGATIVLSSEWRRTEELRSSIGAVLKSYEIPLFRDITPIFHARPEVGEISPIYAWCERRAREIGKWLKDHPEVTSWVALDDLDFSWADNYRLAGTPWMKIRSVLTDARICLTEENASVAVQLLVNPPPEPRVFKQRRSEVEVMGRDRSAGVLCSTEDSAPDRIRLG